MNKISKVSKISMDEVRSANVAAGLHWFDAGTLWFFAGRLPQTAFRGPGGTFFVSSERGPTERDPRRYTVRQALPNGRIVTVGEFQAYADARSAAAAARRHAAGSSESAS